MQALQLQQVCKTYANGVQALQSVDLQVEEGDFFALLGPNGAGKSTIIGIVSSLINKSSGSVTVFGHDLDNDLLGVKSQLGLVPQEFNFNPFETVLQIVTNQAGYYGIALQPARRRAEYYLNRLDLWGKRHQAARTLSGGMKRRLMIARALIHQPRLLILDEPTAGVDIEQRHAIWAFLKALNSEGITILLTTHYLEEAEQLCRSVGIMKQGKLIAHSAMQSLLSNLKLEKFILDVIPQIETLQLNGYPHHWQDQATLIVEVSREQGINSLFEQLSRQGVTVISLRNQSNRLEQLLLSLLRDEQKDEQQEEAVCSVVAG